MISVSQVIAIHSSLMKRMGGLTGVRDIQLLKKSISTPFYTVHGKRLYPSIEEKAGALIVGIVSNRPFIEGNKRMAYILMRLFLKVKDFDLNSNEKEKYEFFQNVISSKFNSIDIKDWISNHIGEGQK